MDRFLKNILLDIESSPQEWTFKDDNIKNVDKGIVINTNGKITIKMRDLDYTFSLFERYKFKQALKGVKNKAIEVLYLDSAIYQDKEVELKDFSNETQIKHTKNSTLDALKRLNMNPVETEAISKAKEQLDRAIKVGSTWLCGMSLMSYYLEFPVDGYFEFNCCGYCNTSGGPLINKQQALELLIFGNKEQIDINEGKTIDTFEYTEPVKMLENFNITPMISEREKTKKIEAESLAKKKSKLRDRGYAVVYTDRLIVASKGFDNSIYKKEKFDSDYPRCSTTGKIIEERKIRTGYSFYDIGIGLFGYKNNDKDIVLDLYNGMKMIKKNEHYEYFLNDRSCYNDPTMTYMKYDKKHGIVYIQKKPFKGMKNSD
jgi:hypothetical protein